MKIIAITNNRGGVGKTFITLHLAWYGQSIGDKVFVIDADTDQANAVMWATGLKIKDPDSSKVYYGYDDLPIAWTMGEKVSVNEKYNGTIFVDGRPQIILSGQLFQADVVVIPIEGILSVVNAKAVIDTMKEYPEAKKMVIVMNKTQKQNKIFQSTYLMAKTLGCDLFPVKLPFNKQVYWSEKNGKPVWVSRAKGVKPFLRQFKRLYDFLMEY